MTGVERRRPFVVCIHDATPAYARETREMVRDLAPLVGRRLTFGVVPDWQGAWPLAAHPGYCRLVREASEERLLHGYFHERRRGWGPISLLAGGSDEMNGLNAEDTRRTIARGQRAFVEAFGAPARGFLAPAWQAGHLRTWSGVADDRAPGLDHVLGFFHLASRAGRRVPLATWSWDCGRWGWLGHVGHATGRALQGVGSRVPVLAIHPRDLTRGYWPTILGVARDLLARRYEPVTVGQLLATSDGDVDS